MTLTNEFTSNGEGIRGPGETTTLESTDVDEEAHNNEISSVPLSFHRRCGELVTLSSNCNNQTNSSSKGAGKRYTGATRTHASQEFNHGLVFSSTPLQDDQIFEV